MKIGYLLVMEHYYASQIVMKIRKKFVVMENDNIAYAISSLDSINLGTSLYKLLCVFHINRY